VDANLSHPCTIQVDDELLSRARLCAERRGTTLEEMLVGFLRDLCEREEAVEAFIRRCNEHAGRAEPGWRFDREECHRRGKDA
jgi:hypothetical protein